MHCTTSVRYHLYATILSWKQQESSCICDLTLIFPTLMPSKSQADHLSSPISSDLLTARPYTYTYLLLYQYYS